MSRNTLGPKIDRLIAAGDALATRLEMHGRTFQNKETIAAWDAACDALNLLEPSEREEPGEAQSATQAREHQTQGAALSGRSDSPTRFPAETKGVFVRHPDGSAGWFES